MKLLHAADIHFDREHQEEALASLAVLAETAERERPAVVLIAGDLWDRGVQNSAASGFPRLLAAIQRILYVCPIAAVSGTPTHDLPGAYDVLAKLRGKDDHDFQLLQPGKAYFKDSFNDCIHGDFIKGQTDLLILALPEPTREWVLAGRPAGSAEETAQAMKVALRGILLGMGAIRAEHPELPCVMLFHGAIEGASMQNGQAVSASDVTLGREDLALVGADYIALGHVHLAQQISGMPAYYPGSAYPVNWGELDQKGCNLVEIEKNNAGPDSGWEGLPFVATVTRIPFPHPPRQKFVVPWPEPVGPEAEGVQAWVVYRATPEEAKRIDTEAILQGYLDLGSLPGSRVTVEAIPTETVRAPEITGAPCLAAKVQVYARASSQEEVSASILAKADALEKARAGGGEAGGGHWRLRRMRLRGAVGIWKGQRKDEIDLNLDDYAEGLVALVGENGAGKSTLIENMHPFPCMLTRDGKLQDHFRLRDSSRELWYTDERTGRGYRILMEIDGANSSGSVKYHIFRSEIAPVPGNPPTQREMESRGWTPLTDGRKESYETEIARLFGSLPLYLRSAFVSQRPTKSNPDLSDASKGERKAIFRELAGLDYLQEYAEAAKGRGDTLAGEIERLRAQAEVLERLLADEPSVREEIAISERAVTAADVEIERVAVKGKELAERERELSKALVAQEALGREIDAAASEAQTKLGQVETHRTAIEGYKGALGKREAAQAAVYHHDELKAQEGAENERLSGINAKRAALSAQYSDALKAHRDDAQKLEGQRFALLTDKERLEGDRKVLLSRAEDLEKAIDAPLTENCPTCGQLLPADKRQELRDEREAKQNHLGDLVVQMEALGKQIDAKRYAAAAIVVPAAPLPPELPPADETQIKRIRAALAQIDVAAARAVLDAAGKAEQEIRTLELRIASLESDAKALTEKIAALRVKLDPKIRPAHVEALRLYEEARTAYTTAREERANAAAKLEAAQKRLTELAGRREELATLTCSCEKNLAEAQEWRLLERACGPDGIQALELDAMGPGISAEANALLSAAYGSRFAIEIRTTRIAGKGAKSKQVEDFAIWVHDSELGTEQPWETLSGGERTWVDRAVYGAFAIILDKSLGRRFLQHFYDEADGALDPEARGKYIAMLQEAHRAGGLRHTILITHSPEVQEMIGQKIEMRRNAA